MTTEWGRLDTDVEKDILIEALQDPAFWREVKEMTAADMESLPEEEEQQEEEQQQEVRQQAQREKEEHLDLATRRAALRSFPSTMLARGRPRRGGRRAAAAGLAMAVRASFPSTTRTQTFPRARTSRRRLRFAR